MVDKEMLEAIGQLIDTKLDAKLEPIKKDILEIKKDVSNLKGDVSEIKENLTEVRGATNYMADWVEKLDKAVKAG